MAYQVSKTESMNMAVILTENMDHVTSTKWEDRGSFVKWIKRLTTISKASDKAIWNVARDFVQEHGKTLTLRRSGVSPTWERIHDLEQRINLMEEKLNELYAVVAD